MKVLLALALLGACTTLGPMPTTTGISAIPAGRPGGEVSVGIAPVFRLSDSASGKNRGGNTIPQLGALFDPDNLLGVPGLFVAARVWGEHGDTSLEPTLGYRHRLDDRLSIAGAAYGTKMHDDENGATYQATRVGGEAALDVKVVDLGTWSQLHAQGAASATYLTSHGSYCYEVATGNAVDCSQDGSVPMINGKLSGVFPAATLTLALDIGRQATGAFHSVRLAAMLAAGWMPRVVNGAQTSGDPYVTGGVSLTLGFGAGR